MEIDIGHTASLAARIPWASRPPMSSDMEEPYVIESTTTRLLKLALKVIQIEGLLTGVEREALNPRHDIDRRSFSTSCIQYLALKDGDIGFHAFGHRLSILHDMFWR